ncbi:hypothetical protein D3C85_238880 [compost metagenome]|jgi:hypothetical protein
MTACEQLHAALRDLEADLKNYKVYGSALITLSKDSLSPELREVYRAVMGLKCRIPVYANDFDQYKIQETGHAVFVIKLTGMVYIQTVVGKLVLPYGAGVAIQGKF